MSGSEIVASDILTRWKISDSERWSNGVLKAQYSTTPPLHHSTTPFGIMLISRRRQIAAPFIDRFDRRKLLLFAYAGFIAGTMACALSQSATALLTARALSGMFGGMSISMVMSIIGDVVPAERRAAGVGIVMTAFSAAAAVGVPFGLQLAQYFRWEAPFFMLAGIAGVMWLVAFLGLPPVRGHLDDGSGDPTRAFRELLRDANAGRALVFMATTVLGHF